MPDPQPPPPWPRRSARADALWLFFVFTLLAWMAVHVARQPGTIATIWLANGAAVALIASAPRQRMPLLLAVVALGNLAANLAHGDALATALAFVPPNTLEVALGAALLHRDARCAQFASDVRHFLRVLVLGAVLPPLLGATLGAAALQGLGFARFERVWVDWYIGALVGAVAMLPLVLSLRAGGTRRTRLASAGSLLVLAAVAGATALVLLGWRYPFVVVGVGLTLVAFVQPRLVSLASAPVVVGTLAVALAWGWYAVPGPDSIYEHAQVYLSLLLAVLPAQLLAVLVARQRALDEMLSAVASREDDIIVFADMQGTVRWVNRARELYRGVPNRDVLGRRLADLHREGGISDGALAMYEQALAGQRPHRVQEVNYPGLGPRIMDVRMQPALDEEGRQIGVLSSANDVTELETQRRELQHTAERLLAANGNLEQFVRIASHDLREPLNTIQQFTMLIEQGPAEQLDDSGRLWFKQVREGAARMRRMLDDVLQFVRLEGTPVPSPQEVPLDELLAEVLAALDARIQGSGAVVSSKPLGTVWGHGALLTLLVQNLVANALKFVPPGRVPRVLVSVDRAPGVARLTVADNGIGIEPQRLPELGLPFRRLHARRKYDGTGLGLAICMRIAQQHGGRIEIQSTPGEGSRFTLVLPQG